MPPTGEPSRAARSGALQAFGELDGQRREGALLRNVGAQLALLEVEAPAVQAQTRGSAAIQSLDRHATFGGSR